MVSVVSPACSAKLTVVRTSNSNSPASFDAPLEKTIRSGDQSFGHAPAKRTVQLKGGVRGKYAARYKAGTKLVLLSPEVAKYFPDEQAVNAALRELIQGPKRPLRRTR
jgi:hypothetical protein